MISLIFAVAIIEHNSIICCYTIRISKYKDPHWDLVTCEDIRYATLPRVLGDLWADHVAQAECGLLISYRH